MCNPVNNIKELILLFYSKDISHKIFCDEFYRLYDLGDDCSVYDKKLVSELELLASTVSRYTDFEEDLNEYPDAYVGKVELTNHIYKVADYL
jgi:hypothetical protein